MGFFPAEAAPTPPVRGHGILPSRGGSHAADSRAALRAEARFHRSQFPSIHYRTLFAAGLRNQVFGRRMWLFRTAGSLKNSKLSFRQGYYFIPYAFEAVA
jgi:hypothetical protein